MTMKTCPKCQVTKMFGLFGKNKTTADGMSTYCRACRSGLARLDYLKNPEKSKANARNYVAANGPAVAEYQKQYRVTNADRGRESKKAFREANPGVVKAQKAAQYVANKESIDKKNSEWQRNNPEKVAIRNSNWKKRNPHKVTASTIARMEHIKRATPPWADLFLIEEAYHLAQLRRNVCGGQWHVDHFVPLRGKKVCGLHVAENLRVITAKANLVKSATFEV